MADKVKFEITYLPASQMRRWRLRVDEYKDLRWSRHDHLCWTEEGANRLKKRLTRRWNAMMIREKRAGKLL